MSTTELSVEPVNEKIDSPEIEKVAVFLPDNLHSAGGAVIEQRRAIPLSGKRIPTGKWEYWTFILFYFNNNGAPIKASGSSLRQALVNLNFPSGYMEWGGQYSPVNTVLLDISGIMFAVQLVVILIVGPFADYGSWRFLILIVAWSVMTACQLGMIGLSTPEQWQIGNGLWIVGQLAFNIMTAFYQATYPNLVRDLPKLLESEQQEHEQLDAYERSKLYNFCNIYGSASVVVWYGVAAGVSYAVGYATKYTLIRAYRILLGYLTAVSLLCTIPYFIVAKRRPGQAIPAGTPIWQLGPKQLWHAIKCARKLKYCLMYLAAYAFIAEGSGTGWSVIGILQNEAIHFSPEISSVYSLLGDLCGGTGTVVILLLHRRYRHKWSIKNILFVAAILDLFPQLWGAIGTFTDVIGFKHEWEFFMFSAWNFMTGAWGSYNITMISEVAPASKLFLFYALFNTVSKTSSFIGPFIGAAIIKRAHGNNNVVFWFCLGMGLIGLTILYFIDTTQAKLDCAEYLEQEAAEFYTVQQREDARENELDSDAVKVVD